MLDADAAKKHFYKGQLIHLVSYGALLTICLITVDWKALSQQSLWGIQGRLIFILSLAMAPLHHFYVWYVWRSELCYHRISPLFKGKGFRVYGVGFAVIALVRVLSVLLVGVADDSSIKMHWVLTWIDGPLMAALALYAVYSTHRYFGYERAIGGDHFFDKYKEMPFVRKGIFRYSSNSMYMFGLMLILLPGIWCSSEAALILGVYHYIAGWIHYFCTERPDINVIYGNE